MSLTLGTIHNGQVKFDHGSPWPEGKRVRVEDASVEPVKGYMTEEEQGDDPESIARWIAWVDTMEPFDLTDEEYERMEQAIADFGKASIVGAQDISEFKP